MGYTDRCPAPGCGRITFRARSRSGAVAVWDAVRIDRDRLGDVTRRSLIGLFAVADDAMRPARVTDPGPFFRLHEGLCADPSAVPKRVAGG